MSPSGQIIVEIEDFEPSLSNWFREAIIKPLDKDYYAELNKD